MESLNKVRVILLLNDTDASHLTQSRGVSLWLANHTGAEILEMEVPLLSGAARKRADAAARKLAGGNRRDARDWLTMADGDSLVRRVGASFAELGVREGARDILIISAGEAAAPYNLALNTSRDGASTTSLGSPFQHLTTLLVKNFPLTSNLNLPSFNLKPFPLVLLNLLVLLHLLVH